MLESLMRMGFVSAIAIAVAGTAGCGSSSTCTDGCGTGGSGTTTGSATTSGSGGQGGSTVATTGSGGGKSCGGKMGGTCASDEYCDYPNEICGTADGQGVCTKKPMACDDVYKPTCACDVMVYDNPCEAARAGFDVSTSASCTPPAGMFPCGSGFCDPKTQYCRRSISDVGSIPDDYSCQLTPAPCGVAPTCPCLANEPCGNACMAASAGGLIVTCPGG